MTKGPVQAIVVWSTFAAVGYLIGAGRIAPGVFFFWMAMIGVLTFLAAMAFLLDACIHLGRRARQEALAKTSVEARQIRHEEQIREEWKAAVASGQNVKGLIIRPAPPARMD